MSKKKKIQKKKAVNKKAFFKKPKKKVVIKKKKRTVKSVKPRRILRRVKPKLKKKVLVKKKKIITKIKTVKKIKKAVKKVLKPKKTVRKKLKVNLELSPEALFKARIKVIGVGGGGGSIVSEIGRSLEKATFVIADTDIRALKKRSGIKSFWFGEELTRGLGTGVNVELAKTAAEAIKEKISNYFKDQDIIIFVASLGGGLGSGATQVFAQVAREFGGITFGIFTMPFKFEGKIKQKIAQNALRELRRSLNVSLVIPNEKIFKIIDESTPITGAFSTINKSLIESLESLIDLIHNPGVINIDFADLRTILRGRGNSAFLNIIEESGKDSVEKICDKIFKNPLLQTTAGFNAEKILFNIAGGDNLSMFQVEKISSHISESNPRAKIIFGISKNHKLRHKIKTTILMTGPSPESSSPEDRIVKKEEPKQEIIEVKRVKTNEVPKTAKKEVEVPNKKKVLEIKKEEVVKLKKIKNQKAKIVVKTKKKLKPKDIILEVKEDSGKKAIRRSGLEIKEAEELLEKKRVAQEQEWEIPAFLRKVKFKS